MYLKKKISFISSCGLLFRDTMYNLLEFKSRALCYLNVVSTATFPVSSLAQQTKGKGIIFVVIISQA